MSEENRDLKTLYDEIRKTVTVNIHRDGFEAIANALYNLALDEIIKKINVRINEIEENVLKEIYEEEKGSIGVYELIILKSKIEGLRK